MGITNFVYNLIENIITLANKYFNLAFIMCLFITWKNMVLSYICIAIYLIFVWHMAISSFNMYKSKKGEKPLFKSLVGLYYLLL